MVGSVTWREGGLGLMNSHADVAFQSTVKTFTNKLSSVELYDDVRVVATLRKQWQLTERNN